MLQHVVDRNLLGESGRRIVLEILSEPIRVRNVTEADIASIDEEAEHLYQRLSELEAELVRKKQAIQNSVQLRHAPEYSSPSRSFSSYESEEENSSPARVKAYG